jgi:mannose-6-phosphate isomerase-like protein (cupin superfamily)
MQRIEKPWGHELIWARTERYVGKILHVRKGEQLSLQYHRRKEETIFLAAGRMTLVHFLREGDPPSHTEMRGGEAFHIPPGMRHRMIALEDCDIFEVSTPDLDDVVRLQDAYGRAGTSDP